MVVNKDSFVISAQDYLEGEEISPVKHEYIRGQVYAMVGASDAHVTIVGNLFVLLRNHLRGKECRVYMADMKIRIDVVDVYYYPDLLVTCDERDRRSTHFKRYPRLIAEVLSPKTEAFDRGGKFADYRQLETLEEYILISQVRVGVECFRRNIEGRWELYPYGEEDELRLTSIDFRCPVTALYEDVALES